MTVVRDLTELRLKDLWAEVKDKDKWWGDLKQKTLMAVKLFLEKTMEYQLTDQLQAFKYGRTGSSSGHRNGYLEPQLLYHQI